MGLEAQRAAAEASAALNMQAPTDLAIRWQKKLLCFSKCRLQGQPHRSSIRNLRRTGLPKHFPIHDFQADGSCEMRH